jgi:hypothetical protein
MKKCLSGESVDVIIAFFEPRRELHFVQNYITFANLSGATSSSLNFTVESHHVK